MAYVSIGLKLDDLFHSLYFLKGYAVKIDDSTYEIVGSTPILGCSHLSEMGSLPSNPNLAFYLDYTRKGRQ
jgi:hypothetical protein